jgi:hypothetical protein
MMKTARETQTMRRMRMMRDAPSAPDAPNFLRGGVSLFYSLILHVP